MKRVLSIIIVLVLCLSLCACNSVTIFSYNTVYTYQHDRWNLYKATQISKTAFKIENWGRVNAGEDGDPFKLEYDLCVISTTDEEINFKWTDDSHTSFSVMLYDDKNSYWKEECVVNFVISSSDDPLFSNKESNKIDTSIKYDTVYTYQHDRWNLYKATQISKTAFKIENWYRAVAMEDADPFMFAYNLCVISTEDEEINFKWTDDSHTSFSVLLHDGENAHWKEERVVTFVISNSDE